MPQIPFLGREQELREYLAFLGGDAPQVMVVIGMEGSGKSSLLAYLKEHTPHDICTIKLDFAEPSLQTDPLKILHKIAQGINAYCNAQANGIIDTMIRRARFNIMENIPQVFIQKLEAGSYASIEATKLELKASELALETNKQALESVSSELYHQLNAQMRRARRDRLVVMFDSCEWLSSAQDEQRRVVGDWVMNDLPRELPASIPQLRHCHVILASRVPLQVRAIDGRDPLLKRLELLEEAVVYTFLEALGVTDRSTHRLFYQFTYGHPLCISILINLAQQKGFAFIPENLRRVQEEYYELVRIRLIQERILDSAFEPALHKLIRYAACLCSFNQQMLHAIFPELLPEEKATERFEQLIRHPYITFEGNGHYAFHDLLRQILAPYVRVQESEIWKKYHQRALEYLQKEEPHSLNRHYHALACDEVQGMLDWRDAIEQAQSSGADYKIRALLHMVYDQTLKFSPASQAVHAYERGRLYHYLAQWEDALASYQEALTSFLALGNLEEARKVQEALGLAKEHKPGNWLAK